MGASKVMEAGAVHTCGNVDVDNNPEGIGKTVVKEDMYILISSVAQTLQVLWETDIPWVH
jgi:hypothetical protein